MPQLSFVETEPKKALGFVFAARCSVFTALMLSVPPVLGYLMRGPADLDDWTDWVQVGTAACCWVITLIWAFEWTSWHRNRDRFRYRLTADDVGLTYANDHKTWRWSWDDLSPFEHVPASWWQAEHVRFRPGSHRWKDSWWNGFDLAAAAAQRHRYSNRGWEFHLLDGFDLRLTELAARLNDHRERALAMARQQPAPDA